VYKDIHDPQKSLLIKNYKDMNFKNQEKTIFHYLQNHTATASMVSKETGIPQKNICRYKRDLQQAGLLCEVRKGYCELTKFRAWYLTTNPDLFPKSNLTKSL
jgi:hypothetical protein